MTRVCGPLTPNALVKRDCVWINVRGTWSVGRSAVTLTVTFPMRPRTVFAMPLPIASVTVAVAVTIPPVAVALVVTFPMTVAASSVPIPVTVAIALVRSSFGSSFCYANVNIVYFNTE